MGLERRLRHMVPDGVNSGWPGSTSRYATPSNPAAVSSVFAKIRENVDFPTPFGPVRRIVGGREPEVAAFVDRVINSDRVDFHDEGVVIVEIPVVLLNTGAKE
jgi:hypothetical protein